MPAKIVKTPTGFQVRTPTKVHGYHMNEENAKKQQRLLNGIEHNPKFAAKIKSEKK